MVVSNQFVNENLRFFLFFFFLHSLFPELVETAPKFDLGKNAKEMVALRCLEGLFAPNDGVVTNNVPASQGSKIRFELSASCEDVLQQILQLVGFSFCS